MTRFLLLTSGAFLACFDSVAAAIGSKLTLASPDTSRVDPVGTDQNNIADERLLRTAQEKVDESKEERVPSYSSVIEWLNTLTESTYATGTNAYSFANKLLKNLNDPNYHWREVDQTTRQYAAFKYLKNEMAQSSSLEMKNVRIDDVRRTLRDSALVYALAHLKVSKIKSQEEHAAEFSKVYFEKLMSEKVSPLDVLPLWIDNVDKDLAVTKGPVIMLLEDFISFSGSQTTMLECFEKYYENANELALALSRGKYHGSETAANLQQELVSSYSDKTFDQVFDICKPMTADRPWNFDMMNEFAIMSKKRDTLLSNLRERFGGDDKLAPKLAEAKKVDEAAKRLQRQLVQDYLHSGYSMKKVAQRLKLNKDNLSSSNLDTIRLFVKLSDNKSAETIDWRKKLAEFLEVDENTILAAEKKGRAEPGQEDMKVSDHKGTEDLT